MGRPGEKRNYNKEYKSYHNKPEQKKKRAARNKANASTPCAGDMDHKKPLRRKVKVPKTANAKTNLKCTPSKQNKGWRKGMKGYRKGKG